MDTYLDAVRPLSDRELLREVTRLAGREREATVRLVASLAELDTRALYLREGYASLFVYCTQALHLSEGASYKRIAAARAAKRFPVILDRLAAGDVTLTTIRLLAPHLTEANHVALLAEARHRSTREVEQIVARLKPQPDVPSTVRKLPTPPAAGPPHEAAPPEQSATAPESCAIREADSLARPPADRTGATGTRPSTLSSVEGPQGRDESVRVPPSGRPDRPITPLAPARYKVSFTIGAETYAKLRDVQDLLRHVVPDGDVAVLFDRALEALRREAAKTKRAATDQPRASQGRVPKPGSRQMPADVKCRVWDRDGGQCAFVSESGHRCTERGFLEYHHVVAYAAGGEMSVDNISLRCRAHNLHEAEQVFGPWQATSVRETPLRYGAEIGDGGNVRHEALVRPVLRSQTGISVLTARRTSTPAGCRAGPLQLPPVRSGRMGALRLAARPVRPIQTTRAHVSKARAAQNGAAFRGARAIPEATAGFEEIQVKSSSDGRIARLTRSGPSAL